MYRMSQSAAPLSCSNAFVQAMNATLCLAITGNAHASEFDLAYTLTDWSVAAEEVIIEATPAEVVVPPSDESRFNNLAAQWRETRSTISSSVTDLILEPAYQQIIGMGGAAVPFILAELRKEGDNPDHWFWALEMITAQNPIAAEDEGDMVRMAQAWLDWGDRHYARELEPA